MSFMVHMTDNFLQTRTTAFSKRVLKLCSQIDKTLITTPIISQLVRSATSIGANYTEAQFAISKADFRNKIYIAKKEAGETAYWLELLGESRHDLMIEELRQEAVYILMTLQKITKTLSTQTPE
jgi:four helix bundle protein